MIEEDVRSVAVELPELQQMIAGQSDAKRTFNWMMSPQHEPWHSWWKYRSHCPRTDVATVAPTVSQVATFTLYQGHMRHVRSILWWDSMGVTHWKM